MDFDLGDQPVTEDNDEPAFVSFILEAMCDECVIADAQKTACTSSRRSAVPMRAENKETKSLCGTKPHARTISQV